MFPPEFEKNADKIIREYLNDVVEELRKVSTNAIIPVRDRITKTIRRQGTIFAFGNGGSHTEAEVFLYALERNTDTRFKFNTVGGPGSSEILDTENECLFEHTLARKGRRGDTAVLVSASGDSANILRAAKLCKKMGIRTASFSANGRIAHITTAEPDYPIVIHLGDQQKLEEVTIGTLLILARQIGLELVGKGETVEKTRENYIRAVSRGAVEILTPALLIEMVEDITTAFRNRNVVRIDATSGILKAPAEHMAHNLIWDARDETMEIWSNLVLSGLLDCHMTGVGNDGGCGFNGAIELKDNGRKGDVEIILATTLQDIKTRRLIKAAMGQGVSVHTLCFRVGDELAAAGLAQMTGHLTGRMTNTRLLLEQGVIKPDNAAEWMRKHDLALLRKKVKIRERLLFMDQK